MKRKPPQLEINWGNAEPFILAVQTTNDGDRIAAEKARQIEDRQHANANQLKLTNATHTD